MAQCSDGGFEVGELVGVGGAKRGGGHCGGRKKIRKLQSEEEEEEEEGEESEVMVVEIAECATEFLVVYIFVDVEAFPLGQSNKKERESQTR